MIRLEGSASEVHFHPTEDRIVVALAPTSSSDDLRMFRKVHVVELQTGRTTSLGNRGKLGQVAWSPDGRIVTMVAGMGGQHDPKEGGLFFMDPVHKREKFRISEENQPVSHFESFGWTSSSEFWSQGTNRTWSIFGHHRFVDGEINHHYVRPKPGIILSGITVSNNGKSLAFIAHHPRHPLEVYCATTQKLQPRRLTDSNLWLKNMQFANQEVTTYSPSQKICNIGIDRNAVGVV